MESNQYPPATRPAPSPHTGLAIASLVLGILALFTSVLLIGALLGLLAFGLGATHLAKRRGPNGMAWSGIALAVLSLFLSAGMATLYVRAFQRLHSGLAEMSEEAAEPLQPSDWIGVEAPNFSITTLEGNTLQLGKLRGRRVVLDFWATWCSPCRMEIPHFNQLTEEISTNALMIVGISDEDEATVKQFMKQQEIQFPVACSTNLPPPFDDIQAVPTTFFIDRNGVIQDVLVGYHNYEQLKKLALNKDKKEPPKKAPITENRRKTSGSAGD